MDLMYFGYTYDADSAGLEKQFKRDVNLEFKNVKLKDSYDQIKGYRQEVILSDDLRDTYLSWIIAEGWHSMSLTMQLLMIDKRQKKECLRLINLAKENYPNNFLK